MTVARLNYTGRRRIPRKEILVELSAQDDSVPSFKVMLNLEDLELPQSALVTAEAYRRFWVQRDWLGHVGDVGSREHGPFELTGLHDAAGVKFRIKVTAADESGERGKLLAVADGLTPAASADTPQEVVSLLPVSVAELGDLVWRVDADAATPPVLKVNKTLGRDIARKPYFRSLVFPAALLQILDIIRLSGKNADEFDDADWQFEWLQFGQSLAGTHPDSDFDGDEWDLWCATVVSHFASRHRIQRHFGEWYEEVEQ